MTIRMETRNLLWHICCCFFNLISSIFKGRLEFLRKYKKQALAVLFLALEAISTVLDMMGKSRLSFVVAALLLSVIGFSMTVYTCFIERTRLQAERQLRAVDIVFSIVQLMATFVHFIMAILGSNNNFNPSFFPLAFAIIAVAFVFQKNEKNIHSRSLLRRDSPSKSTSSHASSTPDNFDDLIGYYDASGLEAFDPHAGLADYEYYFGPYAGLLPIWHSG